jgi:hypothetical protein
MHWFLSYKRPGGRALDVFLAALTKAGIQVPSERADGLVTVFRDVGIKTGALWRIELLKELDDCDGCILFLTGDLDAETLTDAPQLVFERSWLLYEASRLLHRHQFKQLAKVFPIFVGTSEERHALAKWAVLRVDDYGTWRLDPRLGDDELIVQAEQLATEIRSISDSATPPRRVAVENDLLSRLVAAILSHVPDETLRDAILHLLVPPSAPKSAKHRLDGFLVDIGMAKAKRALADALLSGPQPRSPDDHEYVAAYHLTLSRVADDFTLSCRNSTKIEGPRHESLSDFLAPVWVPFSAASHFSDCWIDPDICSRRYVLVYNLSPQEARRIEWFEVLYEFFRVADRLAPYLQDRGDKRRDERVIGDLRRDFDHLRRRDHLRPKQTSLSHFFELSPTFGKVDAVFRRIESYLQSHRSDADDWAMQDNKLPLVLDTTAKLLSKDPAMEFARRGGMETGHEGTLWLSRLPNPPSRPPCVIICVNEREAPDKVASLKYLKDISSIRIDLKGRRTVRESLGLASADAL